MAAKERRKLVEAWRRSSRGRSRRSRPGGWAGAGGRDGEADMLRGALDRSRRELTQLVSIIGEPGIGKTPLGRGARRLVEQLPGLITWRRGRSLSYGEGVAFWALGEMVKSQAGVLESDRRRGGRDEARRSRAAVVLEGAGSWLGGAAPAPAGRPGGPGAAAVKVVAWRRSLRGGGSSRRWPRTARRRWCSRTSTGLTMHYWTSSICWSDRAGAVPLLIVCTARPELLERREHWAGGKTNAHDDLALAAIG